MLAPAELAVDADTLLMLRFDNSLHGVQGESPNAGITSGFSYVPGMIGQAAHTNSNGRLNYPVAGNVQAAQGTVEFWFKPDDMPGVRTLFDVNAGRVAVELLSSDLRFSRMYAGDDPETPFLESTFFRRCDYDASNGDIAIEAGAWQHIAALWDNAGIALYVGGQEVCSIAAPFTPAPFIFSQLMIGNSFQSPDIFPAVGSFDEVRISSRARGGAEIYESYYAGLGTAPPPQAIEPYGIAVDSSGRTIVAQSNLDRVTIYDAAGAVVKHLGNSSRVFDNPADVAVDGANNIYIVDRGNHRIVKYSSAGELLATWNTPLNAPQGIAYDAATDRIYVADTGNHRVLRFTTAGTLDIAWSNAGVLGTSGALARNHTGFDRPTDVAINPLTGEVYISDFGNARIEVYSPQGQYLRTHLAVYKPNCLAFAANGDLYITGEDPPNVGFSPESERYPYVDGRVRILRWQDELITAHYTGGMDDLGRILHGVALRGDEIIVADPLNHRVVATDLTEPASDLRIENRGTEVTFHWRTARPAPSRVRYGVASDALTQEAGSAELVTEHAVTVTGLTPNQRLFYGIALASAFDGSLAFTRTDVINTGVPIGGMQVQRIKALGVIYTDARAGAGYTRLAQSAIDSMRARFTTVADFYYRNSGMRLWLDIQIVEINRDISAASFDLIDEVTNDVAAAGFGASDDIDAIWGASLLTDGNFGGGGVFAGRLIGIAQWVTQTDFVAIHEVNHSIDAIYRSVGLSKYEFNHGIWAVPGGIGHNLAINGQVVRNFLPANFAAAEFPYTKVVVATDADSDGVPDASPAGLLRPLPITELTLGTSTAAADTDGDGLSDLREATFLTGHGINPLAIDSDGDGRRDAADPNPAYVMNQAIAKATPNIDGFADDAAWTKLTVGWGYANDSLVSDSNSFGVTTITYAAWDDQYFYLSVSSPFAPISFPTDILLDGSADNWFRGPDNYALRLGPTAASVRVNVGVPDLFRQIDDDGQFSEYFDDNPAFTKPYQGRYFYDKPNEGPGFSGRLVTEADLIFRHEEFSWEVAIPWSQKTGLRGYAGKEMAIDLRLDNDLLFEADSFARLRLVNAPGDGQTPPRIADIADRALVLGQSMGGIPVTLADDQWVETWLDVEVQVANPSLLTGVTLFGGGAARTLALTAAAHGVTEVTVKARNPDGLEATRSFVVSIPPPLAILAIEEDTGASSADLLTNDAGLILIGTAPLSALVDIQLDGLVIGTVAADADGNWRFDDSSHPLPDGAHAFTAHAGTASAGPFTVTIDTSISAPSFHLGNDTGASAADFITADNVVTMAGSADPHSLLEILLDGHLVGTASADGTGAWTAPVLSPLDDGEYQLSISARDAAGNTRAASPQRLRIDTARPTIGPVADRRVDLGQAIDPVEVTLADGLVSAADLTLSAVSDNPLWLPSSSIALAGSGALRTLTFTPAGGSGSARVTISALDLAGNLQTKTFIVEVLPPNSPPAAIVLDTATVDENHAGAVVGALHVSDLDAGDEHTLVVHDARFEVDGMHRLKLRTGVFLDHEATPVIALAITATDQRGANLTQNIVLTVRDVAEAPTQITLSRHRVFASIAGAWTAEIGVVDPDAVDVHAFTVSDPRFEIRDGHLFIAADQSIHVSAGATIPLAITVHDSVAGEDVEADFVLTVDAPPASWQFAHQWRPNPLDVDADGVVSPLDALLIIIQLNAGGVRTFTPAAGGTQTPLFFDVSGDDTTTPLDAVLVINYLNAGRNSEGETVPSALAPPITCLDHFSFCLDDDREMQALADFWKGVDINGDGL